VIAQLLSPGEGIQLAETAGGRLIHSKVYQNRAIKARAGGKNGIGIRPNRTDCAHQSRSCRVQSPINGVDETDAVREEMKSADAVVADAVNAIGDFSTSKNGIQGRFSASWQAIATSQAPCFQYLATPIAIVCHENRGVGDAKLELLDLVMDVGRGENRPIVTDRFGFIEPTLQTALASVETMSYVGVHSKSLSAGGLVTSSNTAETPRDFEFFQKLSK